MASLTLGEAVNRALVIIGEPEITEFTSDNQLQTLLINMANSAVVDIREETWYAEWAFLHDAVPSVATVTSGTIAVTNGGTTVTSKDDDGDDATNFTNVAAGDWLRKGTDLTSYKVLSVDTSTTPHTLELEDAFLGETATASSYKIIRDTYSLDQSDLDEVVIMAYGDNAYGYGGARLHRVDMSRIYALSGGDRHRNTSGKPQYFTRIKNDDSGNPRIVLWPYPDSTYLFDLWHTAKYSAQSTFDANLLGVDAPSIAHEAIIAKCQWAACVFDNDTEQARIWGGADGEGGRYGNLLTKVAEREMRSSRDDNQLQLQTYRDCGSPYGLRGESQIAFDRVGPYKP